MWRVLSYLGPPVRHLSLIQAFIELLIDASLQRNIEPGLASHQILDTNTGNDLGRQGLTEALTLTPSWLVPVSHSKMWCYPLSASIWFEWLNRYTHRCLSGLEIRVTTCPVYHYKEPSFLPFEFVLSCSKCLLTLVLWFYSSALWSSSYCVLVSQLWNSLDIKH